MTSVAEKRRRKKTALAGLELAPIQSREANGRKSRKGEPRDPSIETLKTRCRQMGKKATPEAIRDMRAPWNGCGAGRAMSALVNESDERAGLWDAICHMRRVQAAFDRAIGAPNRHATCLRLLLPVEEMQADAATPAPDERTPEEKQRDATSALMQVEAWLGYVDGHAAGIAKRAVIDDEVVRDADALVRALRCVRDGMTGQRMVYRGR